MNPTGFVLHVYTHPHDPTTSFVVAVVKGQQCRHYYYAGELLAKDVGFEEIRERNPDACRQWDEMTKFVLDFNA